MTDHVGKLDDGNTGLELFYNKGVAEVIDLGALDAGNAEVAVDGGADVTDQEGVACFGDKKGGVFGFGSASDILFDS